MRFKNSEKKKKCATLIQNCQNKFLSIHSLILNEIVAVFNYQFVELYVIHITNVS